jgi:hypothetical protein
MLCGSIELELSPPSDTFRQLVNQRSWLMTLKLSGMTHSNSEAALKSLEDLGNAFAFELDVRNDIKLALARTRIQVPVSSPEQMNEFPMRFPVATYPQGPLELYLYARSASGLPLLQFLAYYQAVEFFFPVYSRQDMVHRLRNALKNPRFDVNDDLALNRMLSIIIPGRHSALGEREQLRLTLRGCLEPQTIREFVESTDQSVRYFTHKQQVIRGASRILLHEGQSDLRDQAADRIYAIRCRVVHTKQDGGDEAVGLLLPSSPEARLWRWLKV